jgi:DNA-binding FrmR family transcriptional regulator
MDEDRGRDVLRRLSSIEGHLAGVRKMIEQDAYCVDILKQTYAVRRAIEKMEMNLLNSHLRTCMVEGVRDGREDEMVDELLQLYALNNK